MIEFGFENRTGNGIWLVFFGFGQSNRVVDGPVVNVVLAAQSRGENFLGFQTIFQLALDFGSAQFSSRLCFFELDDNGLTLFIIRKLAVQGAQEVAVVHVLFVVQVQRSADTLTVDGVVTNFHFFHLAFIPGTAGFDVV